MTTTPEPDDPTRLDPDTIDRGKRRLGGARAMLAQGARRARTHDLNHPDTDPVDWAAMTPDERATLLRDNAAKRLAARAQETP